MRVFKTKWMTRFARGQRLSDESLADAIEEVESGLIDADLGGGLIKKRVARAGGGKSGGYRMLIAYREGERAVFLYGFPKNHRDNIEPKELESLKELATVFLEAAEEGITKALNDKTLVEVQYGTQDDEDDE